MKNWKFSPKNKNYKKENQMKFPKGKIMVEEIHR